MHWQVSYNHNHLRVDACPFDTWPPEAQAFTVAQTYESVTRTSIWRRDTERAAPYPSCSIDTMSLHLHRAGERPLT